MPTPQTTVEPPSTERALGSSDTATMTGLFPAAPQYTDYTAAELESLAEELIQSGPVPEADGYWAFLTPINRDFVNAPLLEDVQVGGGGLPGSPWAPNPVSPGPGSQNPADQVAPPEGAPAQGGGGAFFGNGLASPSDTSGVISSQKLSSLLTKGSSAPVA